MEFIRVFWDDPNDLDGNVEHIAEHGLTIEDVEEVLGEPASTGLSKSSGLPCLWGYTPDGRYILVVYEAVDDESIRVVTAYEVPEPF